MIDSFPQVSGVFVHKCYLKEPILLPITAEMPLRVFSNNFQPIIFNQPYFTIYHEPLLDNFSITTFTSAQQGITSSCFVLKMRWLNCQQVIFHHTIRFAFSCRIARMSHRFKCGCGEQTVFLLSLKVPFTTCLCSAELWQEK